jgi:hypothetical protein
VLRVKLNLKEFGLLVTKPAQCAAAARCQWPDLGSGRLDSFKLSFLRLRLQHHRERAAATLHLSASLPWAGLAWGGGG